MSQHNARCAICGTEFDDWRALDEHERASHTRRDVTAPAPKEEATSSVDSDRRNKQFERSHWD